MRGWSVGGIWVVTLLLLELIEVESRDALAFVQLVDHTAVHWTVVAHDDSGAEVSRYGF